MKKYIAEFIGTFCLVLFGCGTAMLVGCSSEAGSGYLLTALAFGLVIVAMAYSIGNVSGCHINPAVSIGMLVAGRISVMEFIGYIIAQFIGGIAGAAVLSGIWKMGGITDATGGLGSNGLLNGNVAASLIVEAIMTCVFVLVILGVTEKTEYGSVAGLVIGFTLTLIHIFGIGLTGTSVNPARSLGPAIFAGGDALSSVWVFIVAPLVGGIIAALIYKGVISTVKK